MSKLDTLKEIMALLDDTPTPTERGPHPYWTIDANYLIRTVTHIQTGRLVAVTDQELILVDAAWIADTGRFTGALASCDFNEVEPFPNGEPVAVGRGALIDAVRIATLPRVQK